MIPDVLDRSTQYFFHEDFNKLDTLSFVSTDDSVTGTNLELDKRGGWMAIVSAAALDDYHLMSTIKKLFKPESKKPIRFEAKINLTEAAVNLANAIIGLTDTLTTGNLQNGGAGPATTQKGMFFYKLAGGTQWRFMVSNGTTQTSQNVGAVASGSDVTLAFQVDDQGDGKSFRVTPFFNGVVQPYLTVLVSGFAELYAVFGIKAGSASAETLTIDYLMVHQPR